MANEVLDERTEKLMFTHHSPDYLIELMSLLDSVEGIPTKDTFERNPITDLDEINSRLDSIEELVENVESSPSFYGTWEAIRDAESILALIQRLGDIGHGDTKHDLSKCPQEGFNLPNINQSSYRSSKLQEFGRKYELYL